MLLNVLLEKLDVCIFVIIGLWWSYFILYDISRFLPFFSLSQLFSLFNKNPSEQIISQFSGEINCFSLLPNEPLLLSKAHFCQRSLKMIWFRISKTIHPFVKCCQNLQGMISSPVESLKNLRNFWLSVFYRGQHNVKLVHTDAKESFGYLLKNENYKL